MSTYVDGGLSGGSSCEDPVARTPIGVTGNFIFICVLLPLTLVKYWLYVMRSTMSEKLYSKLEGEQASIDPLA